jgi:hypothetical protein
MWINFLKSSLFTKLGFYTMFNFIYCKIIVSWCLQGLIISHSHLHCLFAYFLAHFSPSLFVSLSPLTLCFSFTLKLCFQFVFSLYHFISHFLTLFLTLFVTFSLSLFFIDNQETILQLSIQSHRRYWF